MTKYDLIGRIADLPLRHATITQSAAAVPRNGPAPTVSIVVPCYNYGHFLSDCVESLLDQDGVEVDVLIIDDTSTDDSGDVADALAARWERVTSLRHRQNRGHIATYNEGLDLAEGDYVVLLDADDVIAPGALSRATRLMEAHPSVGLVYGHPVNFYGEIPQKQDVAERSWSIWPGQEWIRAQCKRGQSLIYSPEVVMRASTRRTIGGFRPELPHAGDIEMWLRFAAVSDIGRVNGPDQAYRRMHAQSMVHTQYATVMADLEQRLAAYESFFTNDESNITATSELLLLARKAAAAELLDWVCTEAARDEPDESTIEQCVEYARHVYPDAPLLRQWREYQARLREQRTSGRAIRIALRSYAARRSFDRRLTWHRWHWLGV